MSKKSSTSKNSTKNPEKAKRLASSGGQQAMAQSGKNAAAFPTGKATTWGALAMAAAGAIYAWQRRSRGNSSMANEARATTVPPRDLEQLPKDYEPGQPWPPMVTNGAATPARSDMQ